MIKSILKGILGMLILIFIAALVPLLFEDEQNVPAPTTRKTKIITTSKGKIKIGGIAFMDGRDPQSKPPSTVMNINIWDSLYRDRPVCQLLHGSKVKVLGSTYKSSEQRFYFKIESQNSACSGWIPESFLSPEYHAPIGDRI
ncbi:hypothetical protein [Hydrogenimonas cancrithermarum]|uniref:hypothetical protein n=1 Tax=Hydrogenimonas cancrithermarum TaxID=2993563 RepID=UPI0025746FE5|nr:hypothetical protein [Hydrogenimonas cancrithermarum]